MAQAVAAASLAEWEAAHAAGTPDDYESVFGATACVPVQEWEGHEPHALTLEEFETVWRAARAACRGRARRRSASGT
ncbi:hypothetical protein GCM10009731_14010 [Streptomyces globosus]